MKPETVFGAHWGTALKLSTVLSCGILVGVVIVGLANGSDKEPVWFVGMVVLPLVIVLGAALFIIRGYELGAGRLLIERLAWRSEVNLDGLQSVEVDPDAMKHSVRILGNGGLFCYAGKFWNRKLGSYRAYATDRASAVVLRFADRVVVVTPDIPEKFAAQIQCRKP